MVALRTRRMGSSTAGNSERHVVDGIPPATLHSYQDLVEAKEVYTGVCWPLCPVFKTSSTSSASPPMELLPSKAPMDHVSAQAEAGGGRETAVDAKPDTVMNCASDPDPQGLALPALMAAIERATISAVKPLTDQVQDNDLVVRGLTKSLQQLSLLLEERLQEERGHIRDRLCQLEERLRQHAEHHFQQLNLRLEAIQSGHQSEEDLESSPSMCMSPSMEERFYKQQLCVLQRSMHGRRPMRQPMLEEQQEPESPKLSESQDSSEHAASPAQSRLPPLGNDQMPYVSVLAQSPKEEFLQLQDDQLTGVTLPMGFTASVRRKEFEQLQEDQQTSMTLPMGFTSSVRRKESQPPGCVFSPSPRPQKHTARRAASQAMPPYEHWVDPEEPVNRRASKRSTACSMPSFDMKQVPSVGAINTSGSHRGEGRYWCGIEYEELMHIHLNSKGHLTRRLTGRLLKIMDWWLSLEEPQHKGVLARFVRTKWFETVCTSVIIGNAIFMVASVNSRMEAPKDPERSAFVGWELFFLSFYTMEVTLKMMVHGKYFILGRDMAWNCFELLLVIIAIADQLGSFLLKDAQFDFTKDASLLRSLRVLKLVKILRVMRIMRIFEELRLLLRSVVGSCVSLLWSFIMLAFVYYFFGLAFAQSLGLFLADNKLDDLTLKDDIILYFGSVEQAMLTLFKATSGGNDWDYYYETVRHTGWHNCMLYIGCVGFIQLSLMNILTAVFVERAMRLAQPDTLAQARQRRLKERNEAEELRRLCVQMDANNSGTVSVDEFRRHIETNQMRFCFSVLGLDIRNAQEFFEMLAFISEDDEVDIDSFVHGCMQMRGAASGIAQQNLIMETRLLRRAQHDLFKHFSRKLERLSEQLKPQSRVG